MINPIKRKKLQESITEAVLNYIETKGLKQGDRLPPERFFCEELQVSRASFREAIKRLESFGLIEIRPGSGMYLRSDRTVLSDIAKLKLEVSAEKAAILDMINLREILELYAVEQLIKNYQEHYLNRLSAILDEYDRKRLNGEIPQKEDYLFHRTLYEASNNKILFELFNSIKNIETLWKDRVMNSVDFRIFGRETEPLHRQIYDAIVEKDVKKAKRLLRKHFEILRKDLNNVDSKLFP